MYKYKKIIENPILIEDRKWIYDHRGSLVEVVRGDPTIDPTYGPVDTFRFGQVYCTTIRPGVVKGFHLHKRQTDRIFLLQGMVRFVGIRVQDPVSETTSATLAIESSKQWNIPDDIILDLIVTAQDPKLITIPPMIWHAFQNIGSVDALVINVPDIAYNYKNPDEIRVDPCDPSIGFPWDICLNG